jgi:hypothetical protein
MSTFDANKATALLQLAAEQASDVYEASLRAHQNQADERAQPIPAVLAMNIICIHRNIAAALGAIGGALSAKSALREDAEGEVTMMTNLARFPRVTR